MREADGTASRMQRGRGMLPPCRASRPLVALAIGVIVTAFSPAVKFSQCQQPDARWPAVARGLGRDGKVEDGYYRVEFPRRDLKVNIGRHRLDPGFELTSYFGFVPTTAGRVLSMGELVLREDEVDAVMAEARRQGVDVPALHNHLIGETPRLMYAHVMIAGEAASVAAKLRALVAKTATPLGKPPAETKGDEAQWSAVSAALGDPAERDGALAEWEFARREPITENGVAVRSSGVIETGSEVVFQRLGDGRAATTGELFLDANEITPVTAALESGGVHVTAIHMHMVHETPRLYWLHWYAVGDAAALAKTVRSAIDRTNTVPPHSR